MLPCSVIGNSSFLSAGNLSQGNLIQGNAMGYASMAKNEAVPYLKRPGAGGIYRMSSLRSLGTDNSKTTKMGVKKTSVEEEMLTTESESELEHATEMTAHRRAKPANKQQEE